MVELRIRDKGFNILSYIYPLEQQIQPVSIWWDRRWQDVGQFQLVIPAQTPDLNDLATLGNFVEVRKNGTFEAIYRIERTELRTGIVTYEQNIEDHSNAIYAAGQGTGTLRDVVVRIDADSVTLVTRMEAFLDARDVEKDNTTLLRQRADAELEKVQTLGTLVAKAGAPTKKEVLLVSGRSLLLYASKRVIIPPPADPPVADVVDISTDDYDADTDSADKVMKHYITNHLINPADGARTVANFVNQPGITPLDALTFQGRFQTVLEALQEIGKLATAGFEVILNASDEFQFDVLPQLDRTADTSSPVTFRSTDVLLDVPGRAYRTDWDIGYLVTFDIESLGVQLDQTIQQVKFELKPGKPEKISVAYNVPTVDDLELLRDAITGRSKADVLAARV